MPAQTPVRVNTAYYSQWDTAPDLRRQLLEADGSAIDLTAATAVKIHIAHGRGDHYYSPYTPPVPWDDCDIESPATTGYVTWTPGETIGVNALWLPGQFDYQFLIIWSDATRQTLGPNTYEKLHVRTRPGGFIATVAEIPTS